MIPNNTYKIATIGDFLVMALTGNINIKMHSSNAASFGLYNIKNNCFNNELINKLGLDINYYLPVTKTIEIMGITKDNIKVINAVGDNQCSVYALSNKPGSLIINFGTGSQISYITDELIDVIGDYEIRPFINNTYLIVGCALSGGYSYSLLKNFFNSLNLNEEINYELLNELVKDTSSSNGIIFDTKFLGTRKNPSINASIEGLTDSNFKVNYFIYSLLEGMVNELYDIYDSYKEYTNVTLFTGSGNGLIKNKKLIEIVEQKFNNKLSLSTIKEEAAYGAAKMAELA